MERKPRTAQDAAQLLQLSELLTSSIQTVISEWSDESKKTPVPAIPSHVLFEAQRTILAITGALTELVSEPPSRINEVTSQFWESRALAIAAECRIPDLLKGADEEGVEIQQIADSTGIEGLKLCESPNAFRCLWVLEKLN